MGIFSKAVDVCKAKNTQISFRISGVSPLVLQRVSSEGGNINAKLPTHISNLGKLKTPHRAYLGIH